MHILDQLVKSFHSTCNLNNYLLKDFDSTQESSNLLLGFGCCEDNNPNKKATTFSASLKQGFTFPSSVMTKVEVTAPDKKTRRSVSNPKAGVTVKKGSTVSSPTNDLVQNTKKDSPQGLPLVVALNCLEDCEIEAESLAGIATLQHVSLAQVSEGKIETAAAVLLHSLAYLPRAAQRCLQPWQLLLCLGSADKSVDSSLASDLGLQLVHIDCGRADEVADSVMALLLGLLRHTHLLSSQGFASAGWLGSIQPICRGMRRCRGQVMGIVGSSRSAAALAVRCLAFKMKVLYFEPEEVLDFTQAILLEIYVWL
ncbi:hypothetical protein O6H91_Y459800 [Diphasiastrum complanatum]|nr:hypothetical protein O6H91_Y459800 [Diphasiastrum complanatum]